MADPKRLTRERGAGRTPAALVGLALASGACASLSGLSGGGGDDASAGHAADAGADAHIVLPAKRDAHDAPAEAPHHAPTDAEDDAPYTGGAGGAVAVSSGLSLQDWCVVTAAGAVWCWGDNEAEQLGNDSGLSSTTPVQLTGTPDPVSSVAVGYFTTCALTKPGGVFCWGYGGDGELGDGTTTSTTATPVAVDGLSSGVVSLSAANLVACAIKSDGSAWCWGDGDGGVLGTGTSEDSPSPTQVTGLESGVTSISVGGDTACAVQNGAVLCWGSSNGYGELGNGTEDASDTPVAVASLASGVAVVAVGFNFVCALTQAGGVLCWGEGDNGELGDGLSTGSPIPVQVQGLSSGVTAITAGNETACAIKDDGTVWCWGYGDDGQLGTGATQFGSGGSQPGSAVPVRVPGLPYPTSISAGNAPCVTTKAGEVECWGLTAEVALYPLAVDGVESPAVAVTLGGSEDSMAFGCATDGPGAVACWGGGAAGQLGDGQSTGSLVAVQSVAIIQGTTSIATGAAADFACALSSGLVQCWGDNSVGQLGDGSTTSSSTPVSVQLPSGVDIAQVAVGHQSACGVSSKGAVYCWGDNTYGELGDGTTASHHVPVEVTGLTDALQVSVGVYFACAVLTDKTVDCWGNNTSGNLGNGTTTVSTSPTPVTGLTGATSVSAGWYGGCAVTSAGGIQCWGANSEGELGSGGTKSTSIAAPVSDISTGATAVAMGENGACAIVSGGVQCWGSSALGDGSSSSQYTPQPVTNNAGAELSGVTAIAVGLATACAVVNGGIQCWGSNTAGQLGDGAPSNELIPARVPGFP